jgi:PAS domain S-box-containing protein
MTRRKPKRKKQNAAAGSRLAALEAEVQDLREHLALERIHFEAALDSVAESRRDLEVSRKRYVDLYDIAPVGYLLLDRNGFIHEANLTAAEIFGMPREQLRGTLLSRFISKEHRRTLLHHLSRCRHSTGDEDVITEVTITGDEGRLLDIVLMSRTESPPAKSPAKVRFRTALVDITGRKQADQQRRTSEEQFRSLFENAASGMAQLDGSGLFINVNDRFCQITGYSRDELLNKMGPLDLDHPDDVEADRKRIADFFRSKAPYLFEEKRYVHKRGRTLWVRVTAAPIRDDQGVVRRTVAVIEDITARKQAEAALAASEERFRTMAQAVPSFLFETDAAGWNIWTSEGWCRFTGQTPEQVAGHGWAEALHPDDRAANIDRWMQCLKDGVPFESQQRLRRRDGVYVWVIARALAVRDSQGKMSRWVGSVTNVDDIVRVQEDLRESEERFAKAFRTAPNPIGITEVDTGRCLEVNEACLQLFGFSREEVIGNTTLMLGIWPSQDDRARLVERLKAGEPVRNLELSFRTKSGELRHILVSSDLAELGGTLCLITVGNDITERKRAEAALQQWNDTLEFRVHERTAALAEANERWDWVVRATNDGVWDWDLVRDTAYFSPRWKEMHGFQERDRLESTQEWQMRIHPEDRQSILDHLAEYLCGKRGEFWEEYRIQRKDGTYMWVLDRGVAIKDEQGRAVRMVGAETDITWRKGAEQALRFREQQFHALADNVPAHFAYIDRSRRYQFLNKHCEALFQRPAEALQGMSVQDLLGPEDYAKLKPFLDQALAGEPVSFEYRRQSPGDGMCYLSGQYVPDRDDQGNVRGVLALMTDITTLKSNEALLRAREAQLRELGAKLLRAQEEERRRISRDLHDDVMQRMGALALELYGLASTTSSQDEGLQSQLKSFGASAEQLTTDLQRMAHQLHPSILEFGGLETALREQVDEFGSRTGISAEFITKDVPKDIPLDHATCLYRIVQEGLQNVQKHAEATTVLVRLMRTGRGLGLCIHDDGRGVENVDGATQRKGLGLTSMAERVGMLNGVFRIRAKPGQGTELHAWVPLEGG